MFQSTRYDVIDVYGPKVYRERQTERVIHARESGILEQSISTLFFEMRCPRR